MAIDGNSHYETDFGISCALGTGNTKIGFGKPTKGGLSKKTILVLRIADIAVAILVRT
ncbi:MULTISPECIES: hypothetical protein [Pseudanabaena]|jgi:hypothetical protein|uniref:hypothetical protein n=1 Tax=Pseudanabaena TaxID=1152 RepID=UPI00247A0B35|nr:MULTISPECIES: hypothetical protein [Pseudanabaena]MEA5485181.1 hypothetical protein [Pseudanabaena sp. CCNP1317]WGS72687.1 hypothetical protein OA858_01280 [Pseudanabaena galeata CCNP1313]